MNSGTRRRRQLEAVRQQEAVGPKAVGPKAKVLTKLSFVLIFAAIVVSWTSPVRAEFDKSQHDLENILYMTLKTGLVIIQTYPEVAPNTVARVKELVRQGFYNGLLFHRVIPDFMAQTGDPLGNGTGGSGQTLKPEYSDRHHLRGVLAMARGEAEDSADSQFFIIFQPKLSLDGQYTIWGRVIDGMQHVDSIKKGSAGYRDGEVINPDKIVTMRVAADVEGPKKSAVNSYPAEPVNINPTYPSQPSYQSNSWQPSATNPVLVPNPVVTQQSGEIPQVPLPSLPVEPPRYDTVFPAIPEGGYVQY